MPRDEAPPADELLSAEERRILEELDRLNPEGAVEADLTAFPAYLGWPAWTDNWRWEDGAAGGDLPADVDLPEGWPPLAGRSATAEDLEERTR